MSKKIKKPKVHVIDKHGMNPRRMITNLPHIPKDYATMPFGRQIDIIKKTREFTASAMTTHISQKRQSLKAAVAELMDLYDVEFMYAHYGVNNDTFEVFYTTKKVAA